MTLSETTTPAKTAAHPPEPWLYAGIELDHDGDPSLVLIEAAGGKLGERRLFGFNAKHHRRFNVGWVYQLPTARDGERVSITFDDRASSRAWGDPEERQAISAASRAAEARMAADKAAERMAKEDTDLDAILRPLKLRYVKLRASRDRIAFELLVIEALRGGRR